MGALRAAELDRFGMRGIGEVYRLYAEGVLEDDDEVAVAHADAEQAFRPVSDAMVDVRATLSAAVAAGVVSEETAAVLAGRVKATFYPRRRLELVLDDGDAEQDRLRTWLPDGRVERKRLDALALLRTVRDDLAAGLEPFRPSWQLQRTRFFETALRSVRLAAAEHGDESRFVDADGAVESLLDELRLDPERFARLGERSLLTTLAAEIARRTGADVSPSLRQTALDEERHARGLDDPAGMRAWLEQRGLGEDELPKLAGRLAALRWARRTYRDAAGEELLLALRLEEDYPALAERAEAKRALLAEQPSLGEGPSDKELVAWYFAERLGTSVPLRLQEWSKAQGWGSVGELVRALRAEWAFVEGAEGGDALPPPSRDPATA